jgi:hypothetical protein
MFIMAIGLLALMVLFPLGALNMGQALKDDRCASTAAMAEQVAVVQNIRHDTNVVTAFSNNPGLPVYVDPNGVIQGWATVGQPPSTIPRVSPAFIGGSQALADRWFSLPDDVKFSDSSFADTTAGFVDRGRRYSFAYLLRRPNPSLDGLVQLIVVVYSNRPVGSVSLETTLSGTVTSPNGLQITATQTSLKRGGWIMDTGGNFFRVTNLADAGGTTTIEVSPDFPAASIGGTVTFMIMDYVAEVFDKGTSWQP